MGVAPDFRLEGGNPVGFGFGLQIGHCFSKAGQAEDEAPQTGNRRQIMGLALIQPQHGRPQGLAVFIDIHHRCPLGGQGDTGDPILISGAVVPETPAGPAHGIPEDVGVLLGPGGLFGEVRRERHKLLGQKLALEIKDQRFQTLSSVVNRQQQVFFAH